MVSRLRFLAAWLPMRRALHDIQSDWHAWDIGWNNGRRQSLDGASTGKPAIGILSIDRFLLSLWGRL